MKTKNYFLFVGSTLALISLLGCGDSPLASKATTSKDPQAPSPKASGDANAGVGASSGGANGAAATTTESFRCDLEFKKVDLCAQMTWVSGPKWDTNTEDPMEIKLEFWDPKSSNRVSFNYEVAFDSAMPAMNNHPLATKPKVFQDSGALGIYTVNDIRISCLGGDWSFFFQLKDGGKIVDQVRYVWVRDEHLIN